MPNIPTKGAAGQIDVPAGFEAREPTGQPVVPEASDDRPTVTVGAQEHGPNSPAHGAAGGYDIDFGTHGAAATKRPEPPSGTGLKDAALGG